MYEAERPDKAGQVSGENEKALGEGIVHDAAGQKNDEKQQCDMEDLITEQEEEEERERIERRRFEEDLIYGMSLEIAG